MQRIGLISDTHGLLRPEALDFLRGSAMIVHAGDICDASVLRRLAEIAPTFAVRGNNDVGAWADELPASRTIAIDEVVLHVIHDISDLRHHPAPEGALVVHGHSHRPTIVERDGRRFVNPGSAGPRRFSLPISIGEARIDGDRADVRLTTLEPRTASVAG